MRETNIHESEWADLDAELKHRDRSRTDFEFSETVEPLIGTAVQALRGHLVARNRKTGQERKYWTGNANSWVVEFVRDIDAGIL
jgi:hypothetical protein